MSAPFDIPELRHHLSFYLGNSDLLSCILTCKSWQISFTPALYYHVVIDQYNVRKHPPIEKYYIHVKSLTITDYMAPMYYSIGFTNLVTIKLYEAYRYSTSTSILSTTFLSRILMNSKNTLRSFSLEFKPVGQIQELWDALFCCNNINYLSIHSNLDITIDPLNLVKFATLFSNVTTLHLKNINVTYDQEIIKQLPALLQSSKLAYIQCYSYHGFLNGFGAFAMHLISKSPNLRGTTWLSSTQASVSDLTYEGNQHVYRELIPSMKSKMFRHLNLVGYMCDGDTALMINAMTDARNLILDCQCFGLESYITLVRKHSNTISTLKIQDCQGVASSTVQGILTNCPSLRVFRADCIQGTDLVRIVPSNGVGTEGDKIILGEDWVCLNLYELQLFFDLSGDDANIDRSKTEGEALFQRQLKLEQYHSFRQISRLHSLHTLDISSPLQYSGITTLKLRLKSNGGELDQLCTLKKLRILRSRASRGTSFIFGKEEQKWMDETWSLVDDYMDY